jgi:hypothetical protein
MELDGIFVYPFNFLFATNGDEETAVRTVKFRTSRHGNVKNAWLAVRPVRQLFGRFGFEYRKLGELYGPPG